MKHITVHIHIMVKNNKNMNCNNFQHLGPRESLLEFYKCYSYSINPNAEWRQIPGFPNYSVSSCGLVLNNYSYGGKSRIVVPTLRNNTYFYVTIYSDDGKRIGVPVDRLVALA